MAWSGCDLSNFIQQRMDGVVLVSLLVGKFVRS